MNTEIIQHNLQSMFADRQLNITGKKKAKNTEKLSSGYRINRSADDAAGLAISEKMRYQIRGLDKASQNIQDGISFVQTAEGALNEVHAMLQRIRELAVQASNDTNTDLDRAAINEEVTVIKKEMQRVFDTTEFNTKKIFLAPYTPNILNEPQDYAMFNVGAGGSETGGVLINNKRFTWGELGVAESWSTPAGDDRDIVFYDKTKDKYGDEADEKITLRLKAGETLPKVNRVYEMTADDTGIKINDIYAGKWDEDIEKDGDTYSFSFHGMDISFTADSGADRASIIEHLNPDGFDIISFDAIPSGVESHDAVHTSADNTMKLYVTNENSAKTGDTLSDIEKWVYKVTADEEGIEITQDNYTVSDKIDHEKIKWEDFSNIDKESEDEEFPIVDYGTSNDNPVTLKASSSDHPVNDNPITLDDSAKYHYSDIKDDPKQPEYIEFDFNFLRDEIGKAEAMKGITQTLSSSGVVSPIQSVTDASQTVDVLLSGGITFHFQRDQLLRDFGDDNGGTDPMDTTVVRSEKIDDGHAYIYQERKALTAGYLGWRTDYSREKWSVTTNEYFEITKDEYGNDVTSGTSDTSLNNTSTSETTYERNYKYDYVFEEMKNQDRGKTDHTENESIVTDNSEKEVKINGKTYLVKTTIDYHTKELTDSKYDGVYVSYDDYATNTIERDKNSRKAYGKFQELSDESYIYLSSYNGDDPTLTRDVNSAVYQVGEDSDDFLHYVQTGSAKRLDYVYDLSHYEYEMKNKDGSVIMTGKSEVFVDTSDNSSSDPAVIDSDADLQYDLEHGITRTTELENGKRVSRQSGSMLNIRDSITYTDEDGRNATTKKTDLSIRDITLTGKDIDGITASVKLRYDDRENTTGDLNKEETVTFTPNGRASRSFFKPDNTAGKAVETNFKTKVNAPEKLLHIQSGAGAWQSIDIKWPSLSNSILGIWNANTLTYNSSQDAIASTDEAIDMISTVRNKFGAYQNRLEHAYDIDRNIQENTQAAESRIRDTDMAMEMVSYSKNDILQQAGQSVLSQANQSKQGILSLIQ